MPWIDLEERAANMKKYNMKIWGGAWWPYRWWLLPKGPPCSLSNFSYGDGNVGLG
jgi:hypothetical protein